MNIWAWVRQTRARLDEGDAEAVRLSELIGALPTAVVNEAHARVDVLVPEAVELARALDEPWVEVFARHWSLQSRVLHRRRAGVELREAVELLDFASRSRTRACPQSVCSVQDLAVCYAIRDGPGYVPERLAVASETLERIDPSWGCWDCINGEYVSALLDDARPAEALAWIDRQLARAAEHGELTPGFNAVLNRARALRELGRGREALAILDGVEQVHSYGSARVMAWRQARVAALLSLAELDAALSLHPPLSAVIETGSHLRGWFDNTLALVDAGALANDAALGRDLHAVTREFVAGDAYWDTARTALLGAKLAVARGARVIARLGLNEAEATRAKLRRPQRLEALARAVEDGLAELDARALAADTDTAVDELERRLDRLWPRASSSHQAAELELAKLLRELGRGHEARARLDSLAARGSELDAASRRELAATMLATADHAGIEQLCAEVEALEPALAWLLGRSLIARGDHRRAIELDRATLDSGLADDDERERLWLRVADSARALEDWAAELDALDHVAAGSPALLDWRRLLAATILGDWSRVRAVGARLGLELDGEGDEPIDVDVRVLRCVFVSPHGERSRHWAVQTSPCTARIVEIALPWQDQHFRDRVAIEPPEPDGDASQEGRRVVTVLSRGGYRSFLVRGFDPGEAEVESLAATIRARGWGFERISEPGRDAVDPRPDASPDARTPTMAVLVATLASEDSRALADVLAEYSVRWPLPLLCPALDRCSGDADAAARALALLEHWQP